MPSPDILARAASVSAPRATVLASAKGGVAGKGIICLSVSGTAALFLIPTWLSGKFVSITPSGASCDMIVGGSSIVAVYAQASSVASNVITVDAGTGDHIPDGARVSYLMPSQSVATHMSIIASAAGKIYIALAEP